MVFIKDKKNGGRKSYSYAQRKAYWQGIGFSMASGHTLEEQNSYYKKMKKNKTFDSFLNGTVKTNKK